MAIKRFPTARVLTVYTGVCMGKGIGVAQDVFDHLYPGIMTLGCGAKHEEAAKELARQHPLLLGLSAIKPNTDDYLRFLEQALTIFGETMTVEGPLPGGGQTGVGLELAEINRIRGGRTPNT